MASSRGCIACPSHDLFVRKDFSQRLGVTIVTLGFHRQFDPWYYGYPLWTYAILFATAAIDIVLYLFMPRVSDVLPLRGHLNRDGAGHGEREHFDLEIHEKHRHKRFAWPKRKRRRQCRSKIHDHGETRRRQKYRPQIDTDEHR